jgi:hypothetical protein
MAPKYPLGTKSADGSYAIGKNGHTLPLEYVPLLGSFLRSDKSSFDLGGQGGGSGNSSSGGFSVPPQQPGQSFAWQFPQYSQTWAFTPPAPSAFRLPPAFDPKTSTGYAAPPKTTTAKPTSTKSTSTKPASTPFGGSGSSGAFDLAALFGKYR